MCAGGHWAFQGHYWLRRIGRPCEPKERGGVRLLFAVRGYHPDFSPVCPLEKLRLRRTNGSTMPHWSRGHRCLRGLHCASGLAGVAAPVQCGVVLIRTKTANPMPGQTRRCIQSESRRLTALKPRAGACGRARVAGARYAQSFPTRASSCSPLLLLPGGGGFGNGA